MTIWPPADVFSLFCLHRQNYGSIRTECTKIHRYVSQGAMVSILNLVTAPVPVVLAAVAARASIYDVPGGFRAVMFDRFSGVRGEVCLRFSDRNQ
jgi:hypothetical protein